LRARLEEEDHVSKEPKKKIDLSVEGLTRDELQHFVGMLREGSEVCILINGMPVARASMESFVIASPAVVPHVSIPGTLVKIGAIDWLEKKDEQPSAGQGTPPSSSTPPTGGSSCGPN
jgi:hypothetical protein